MLSSTEQEILEKLEERSNRIVNDIDEFDTQYYYQDNFIVCIILNDVRIILSVGVSKRNPIDPMSNDIGEKRAFNRAIRSLIGH